MRKFFICFMLMLYLTVPLLLRVAASEIYFPPKSVAVDDYEEYKNLLRRKDAKSGFIAYGNIADLGEFDSFVYYYYEKSNDPSEYDLDYEYYLKTQNGTIITVKNCPAKFEETAMPFSCAWIGGKEGDIAWLDSAKIFLEYLKVDIPEFFVLEGRFAEYRYSGITGRLLSIRTDEFLIEGDFTQIDDVDTPIERLLNYETTHKAVFEILANIYGIHELSQKQPLTICLAAIGGAAVAAVTAWAITYFVMRKRAKNPPRPATCAGIDVPTEDAPAVNAPAFEATPDGAQDSTPTPPDR